MERFKDALRFLSVALFLLAAWKANVAAAIAGGGLVGLTGAFGDTFSWIGWRARREPKATAAVVCLETARKARKA